MYTPEGRNWGLQVLPLLTQYGCEQAKTHLKLKVSTLR